MSTRMLPALGVFAAARAFLRWAARAIGAVTVGGLLFGVLLTDGFSGGSTGMCL